MKKSTRTKRIAALGLALTLALSACTKSGPEGSDGPDGAAQPLTEFIDWELAANEMTSFLMPNTEESKNLRHMGNMISALLTQDNHGRFIGNVATEWGADETGFIWTFKLRNDVTWVDVNGNYKGDCTAQDWLTSMEWILNYHKNGAQNTSMLIELIDGAGEYYEYSKTLTPEEGMATHATDEKFLETVGISAADPYALQYRLTKAAPYFYTVAGAACMCPIPQGMIDELGVENVLGVSPAQLWYSGPYTMTEFVSGNTKTFTKNEAYFDKDSKLFDTVTIKMIEDGNADDNLFINGEVDRCELSESRLRIIWEDENSPWRDKLVQTRPSRFNYQVVFNYGKKFEDGTPDTNWNTAVANEAFRKSLYYGLDFKEFWSLYDFINPESNRIETFVTRDVVTYSDGTDYVDKLMEIMGTTDGHVDAAKAQDYVAQAKSELAGKVTFPIQADYYIKAGDQTAQDQATVLKNIFENLAEDYIQINIKTYITNVTSEVRSPALASFEISGWGADYRDPENFLNQLVTGNDSAIYTSLLTKANTITDPETKEIFAQFSQMVAQANAIVDDLDARYEAQAQAEAFYYEHALMIPCRGVSVWSMTKENTYSHPGGSRIYRNWETSSEPYTAEQYEQLKAAFEAELG